MDKKLPTFGLVRGSQRKLPVVWIFAGLSLIFFILFVYTALCFFSVKKLHLTEIGVGVFMRPLTSGWVTSPFYKSVTSRILGVFIDKSDLQDPYPDNIFPLSGELYSGGYLYGGRAVICEGGNQANHRICLKLKSGRTLMPIFIDSLSEYINDNDPSLNEIKGRFPYPVFVSLKSYPSQLAVGANVEVVLYSTQSPTVMTEPENDKWELYFNTSEIREIRLIK